MAKKKTHQISFEETLNALEQLVTRLESGGLSLNDSLSEFEQAVKLTKQAKQQLRDAEQRIDILLNENTDSDPVEFTLNEE